MDYIEFVCKQCGLCCESLVKTIDSQKKGLSLQPDEKDLFPNDLVAPSMGLGKNPMNVTKILTYQVKDSKCPYLNEDKICEIYDKRPTACRVFPLIWLGPQYGTVLAQPDDCVAVRDIEMERGSLDGITFSPKTLHAKNEWKYLRKESDYLQKELRRNRRRKYNLYSFNLATNRWELYL